MNNEEIALNLLNEWMSQQKHDLSVEKVAQAYLDFLHVAEQKELPSDNQE